VFDVVLRIETILKLVMLGVTTTKQIVEQVQANRITVPSDDGILTADEVEARCDAALEEAKKQADRASVRIQDRHAADGTGHP
jgi:hypothetical protein